MSAGTVAVDPGGAWQRITHAASLNVRLQARAYFLHVYGGVTLITVCLLWFAIPEAAVAWLLPVFLFAEPGMLGTNMVGAFRYLEKGEGTVAALMVTPLRPVEYIVGLSLGSALVGAAFGSLTFFAITLDVGRSLLAVGPLFGAGFLSSLLGFGLSMRYADFPRFILGAIPWVALWQLPLLAYLEVVPWPAVAWVPSSAGLYALAELTAEEPSALVVVGASLFLLALCVPGSLWIARSYERRIHERAEFA